MLIPSTGDGKRRYDFYTRIYALKHDFLQLVCWVRKLTMPIFLMITFLNVFLYFIPQTYSSYISIPSAGTQINTYISNRRTRGLLHKLSGIASMIALGQTWKMWFLKLCQFPYVIWKIKARLFYFIYYTRKYNVTFIDIF